MGFLDRFTDSVTDFANGPLKLASGVVNGAKDGASLVDNLLDGDMGGALQDGFKLADDLGDIGEGLTSLGFGVGPLPTGFNSMKSLVPAESKILWLAQLAIDGMKLTTGSGNPTNGDEFRGSSERLATVVDTLIAAEPHTDRWDGTASQVYNAVNASHRRVTFEVEDADLEVAKVLDIEAEQVGRTRETLDDQIDWLKAYDYATMAMNATGPSAALKMALDTVAAATATGIAGSAIGVLFKNSLENASRIRDHLGGYEGAAKDTSGKPMGGCEVFAVPDQDDPDEQLARPKKETPLPDSHAPTKAPSRSDSKTTYTVPSPEEPIVYGPPATPYGNPAPLSPTTPSTPPPTTSKAPAAAGPPPAAPTAPQPKAPAAAAPAAHTSQRAPVAPRARGDGATPVPTARS
ncbi:EspA/EspE family type VII secretion system effector [Mycobacterium sp. DL440]|uniref:EspA/EspE family type VII secretion system effector n=1 Tax=Mycobacterium sp. DL440 TaxID=2675523 RepID=UPI001420E4DF|nr:EspA/EspE family type VII secretion system effector [Mycobacterium sp. DL440]